MIPFALLLVIALTGYAQARIYARPITRPGKTRRVDRVESGLLVQLVQHGFDPRERELAPTLFKLADAHVSPGLYAIHPVRAWPAQALSA